MVDPVFDIFEFYTAHVRHVHNRLIKNGALAAGNEKSLDRNRQ